VEAIKAITERRCCAWRAARSRTTASTASRRCAALAADDVLVLRAYAKYLKQAGFTFSQAYIEQTLAAHPEITRKLVALFHARFDPALSRSATTLQKSSSDEVKARSNAVPNADEDRILRRFLTSSAPRCAPTTG
jgi:glutamate dehydrogenase